MIITNAPIGDVIKRKTDIELTVFTYTGATFKDLPFERAIILAWDERISPVQSIWEALQNVGVSATPPKGPIELRSGDKVLWFDELRNTTLLMRIK